MQGGHHTSNSPYNAYKGVLLDNPISILLAQHLISHSSADKPLPPGVKGGLLIFFIHIQHLENFSSS